MRDAEKWHWYETLGLLALVILVGGLLLFAVVGLAFSVWYALKHPEFFK